MKKYTFSFRGRQTGAIGIFYNITDTYETDSINKAVSMLFTDYENFTGVKLNGKPFEIKNSHFVDIPDYKRLTPPQIVVVK